MAIQYVDANCDAVGSLAGPFTISSTNNTLAITIDGGSAQTITLTTGSRTAAQVATDINAVILGATASGVVAGGYGGRVRLRTASANGASSTVTFGAPSNNAAATLGFGTSYSGASRAHTSWTQSTGTKQELINQIETQLDAVGWRTVSGSGTTNLLLESALTPPGQELVYRLRVRDNAGNGIQLSIENVAGTVAAANSTTHGVSLNPAAGRTWVFTCHKYGAAIRTSTGNYGLKQYALFGSVALPAFLQGTITDGAYIQSASAGDTDQSSVGFAFNNAASALANSANQQMLLNNAVLSITGYGNNFPACQVFMAPTQLANGVSSGVQWHDGSVHLVDALIAYGITATSDTGRYRGYIWDAVVVGGGQFGFGATTTFDTHNWIVLTDMTSWNNQSGPRAQLLLVTP